MQSRQDFQNAARALVEPLVPYLERDGGALDLEEGAARFDMKASALEGVARPFWGLAPLAYGGGTFAHWDVFLAALREGVNPSHPHYWGPVGDVDQRAVEMAAIGFLLAMVPEKSWNALPDATRNQLAVWLADIQNHALAQNNWLFFTVLAQEGLKRVGRCELVDDALENRHLQQLADWFRGDGWYGDGDCGAIDHYGGFAMHFYGLVYAWLKRDDPDEFAFLFRRRAAEFAGPFSRWFADNGEAMIQGRSLTYRFATAAFWGMLAVSGERPLSLGRIKGLWARQIRLWRNRPIFRPDGVLSRGFAYPNLVVCEEYNSPTSPYWAMKAFMPLALDENDEFWQVEEEASPESQIVIAMPSCDSLVQRAEGHTIAHYAAPIHNSWQSEKYNKFAYSTATGFDVNSLQYAHLESFGDNLLAFSFDDAVSWQTRRENLNVSMGHDWLEVSWTTGKQQVQTLIRTVGEGMFVREHSFSLAGPVQVVETGFAVNQWHCEAQRNLFEDHVILLDGENGYSGIIALDTLPRRSVDCLRVNTNMVSPRTRVPGFMLRLAAGAHQIRHGFWLSPARNTRNRDAFLNMATR